MDKKNQGASKHDMAKFWISIRQRPGMYCGDYKISSFHTFLLGWDSALAAQGIEGGVRLPIPKGIRDWVAYREGWTGFSAGWSWILQGRYPDDGTALRRFFELVDEHALRVPHEFAYIENYASKLPHGYDHEEAWDKVHHGRLSFRVYTDGPGFLTYYPPENAERFHPWLYTGRPSIFRVNPFFCGFNESFNGWDQEKMVVTDHAIYERLIAEAKRYEEQEAADSQDQDGGELA